MDQEQDHLHSMNRRPDAKKPSVFVSSSAPSHSQGFSHPSLLATSDSQGQDRKEKDCSLQNNNHQEHQHQHQHDEEGQYDHLLLARVLEQYRRQQEIQQEREQRQLQQVAASITPGWDGTKSTPTQTTREAEEVTAEASAHKAFDSTAVSANPHVPNNFSVEWRTDDASKTAGRTTHGIAGTAHPNLFESGQKPQLPPQYHDQHNQELQSRAWQSFNQSTTFAAPRRSHSSLESSPFSFHTLLPTFERNKAMAESALHRMYHVLDAIPLLDKMEYAVASRMAPHLVRLESDPIRFLRYANWDPHAAAHKLVAYWKRRVAIFGQDRAYLPLTVWGLSTERTGGTESALSREDVALIEEGFIAYAAHPPFEAKSSLQDVGDTKTVVVFDASRRSNDAWDVRLRASFYHAHCIAENPVSQTEGYVVLCIVKSPQYYDHYTMDCLTILLDTLPVRLKEWHTFDCISTAIPSPSPSSLSSSALMGQGYLFAYFEMFLNFLSEYNTYRYSVSEHSSLSSSASNLSPSWSTTINKFTPDEVRWELETEHGLTAEEIPVLLGGLWTYDAYNTWLRERMHFERSRYFGANHDDVGTLQDDQYGDKRSALFETPMTGVAYDTRRDGRHRHGMGRSSKRSKRDQHTQKYNCEGKEDNEEQAEDGNENEEDGSLEDLMKQLQQLFFRDSSSPAILPKSSHQQSLARPPSAHLSSRNPFSELGVPARQQQEQEQNRADIDTFMSSRNVLHPVVLLEKALNDIPVNDKVEYMTALRVAPRLVAHESDPMRFFVFHDYNAQRAAEGLVHYWKVRHEWFGDRAYLPMTMFSLGSDNAVGGGIDGALTAEDICLVRSGFLAIAGTDRQGSPVLLMDSSRRNTDSTTARFRAAFYIYQVISEFHTSQTHGLVSISIWRTFNMDKVSSKSMQMVVKTLPIKLKALHSVDCMEKNNVFVRGFVLGMLGMTARFFGLSNVHFYTSHSEQDQERNVQVFEDQHGLPRDLLPCSIGGTWNYEKFDEWIIQRTQAEKQLHLYNAHMNDTSLAIASTSLNVLPNSALNTTTLHQSQEAPIVQDPRIHDRSDSSVSADVRKIPENLQALESATSHLPLHETKAFKDALQGGKPQIWEEECNPDLFLRVENFDTQKAAERMAKYWQLRSQTFGLKQYDLLTQTGEDALGHRDRKSLATGFLTLLPTDANGQSILFVDLSRLSGKVDSSARKRCLFYMMSLMTENEKSQTDGAILLHWVHPPDLSLIEVSFLEELVKALPLKLSCIHLISYDVIPVDSVLLRGVCDTKVYIHSGTCKETLCSELELFGMKKAGLPKIVNGEWGYEKFFQWQELRTRIEWKIPAGLSGRDSTNMASFPAMKPYRVLEEGNERQRRLSLIHFRRRQNRNRVERAMLEENCIELENEQKKLLEENRELEKRYATASAIIQSESETML